MKKINYTGSSTIIKRLCEIVNELVDGGGSAVTSVNTKTGDVVLTTSDLQNDSGYITNAVNDLTNYYLKSETYTKSEVNSLIGTFVDIRVVSSLPTTDISQTTIYLVPKSVAQTNNLYDEYINLDGTSQGWEKIGDTEIDLSNYIQKSQTSGLVKNDGTIDTNTYSTTDENVKQTATTGNYDFRVLLSATATDGDYTGVVKKNTSLRYNASTGNLQTPMINGSTVGSSPEFTDLKVLYGTCDTAADNPDKKVVLQGTTLLDSQYTSLPVGTFLVVRFTNTNTASSCTMSIVDNATTPTKYTTPASFYYSASVYTSSGSNVCGYANRYNQYLWDGTYWVWCGRGLDADTTYSAMSQSELVTGTATNQRTERADYLNAGIRELIRSYGWGTQGATTITGTSEAHADLNTYITPGNYTCTANTTAAYVDNKPTGSTNKAFNLIVIKTLNSNSYIRQVAWVYDSVNFYIRQSTNGGSTWGSWNTLSPNNIPSAFCVTSASTAAKTASCTYFNLKSSNQYVHVLMRYTNTVQGAITLNINSTGAKPIYINGEASSSTNYDLKGGTYLVFYDGTNYYFRTDNKLPADIDGSADYLRGMNTSSVSSITNSPGDYKANIENIVSSATTGLFPAADNSNAILQVNRMNGNYDSQLGFSSNGELYYRSFNNEALNSTKYWGRILKEYRFVKSQTDYSYFYFSLPSANAIWLEINGMYNGQFSRSVIYMETWQSLWAPTEPKMLSWGEGASTKAWIGKTNNVPWLAIDAKATLLNVKVFSSSSTEGVTIIDYQHNATNPTSESDQYRSSNKIPTSNELYHTQPQIVSYKGARYYFNTNYDIKRVFIEKSLNGITWQPNGAVDITAEFKSAIGDKHIRILTYSSSVYWSEASNEKYNCGGGCRLFYFYQNNAIDHVSLINTNDTSYLCGSGSYVTILLEYIEL